MGSADHVEYKTPRRRQTRGSMEPSDAKPHSRLANDRVGGKQREITASARNAQGRKGIMPCLGNQSEEDLGRTPECSTKGKEN